MTTCIKCGKEIPDGELFCAECGLNPGAALKSHRNLNPQAIKNKAFHDSVMKKLERNPVYDEAALNANPGAANRIAKIFREAAPGTHWKAACKAGKEGKAPGPGIDGLRVHRRRGQPRSCDLAVFRPCAAAPGHPPARR